jgi:hypothetical protein
MWEHCSSFFQADKLEAKEDRDQFNLAKKEHREKKMKATEKKLRKQFKKRVRGDKLGLTMMPVDALEKLKSAEDSKARAALVEECKKYRQLGAPGVPQNKTINSQLKLLPELIDRVIVLRKDRDKPTKAQSDSRFLPPEDDRTADAKDFAANADKRAAALEAEANKELEEEDQEEEEEEEKAKTRSKKKKKSKGRAERGRSESGDNSKGGGYDDGEPAPRRVSTRTKLKSKKVREDEARRQERKDQHEVARALALELVKGLSADTQSRAAKGDIKIASNDDDDDDSDDDDQSDFDESDDDWP